MCKFRLAWLGILFIGLAATDSILADSTWYPFPVEISVPGEGADIKKTASAYIPLEKTSRKWNVCVSFPHMKDSYWLAVNFGIVKEIQRLGIQMQLYEAGGYEHLSTQIEQIKSCAAAGSDGIIIGAISYDGLNGQVAELRSRGIPVIDAVNGMSSDQVSAHSLVSFEEMGFRAGESIAQGHPAGSTPVKVAWFPGPEGAGWVNAGDNGFRRALTGSAVEIVAMRFGDTGKTAQTRLLEEVLKAHPDIDYVAGTAVTAAAAVKILRDRNLDHRIKIVSYYFTPDVHRQIKRGRILAAPTDSAVIQGRIAVDQLVRIMERQPFIKQVGPRIQVIDRSNIDSFDRSTSMAPSGFKATYSINTLVQTDRATPRESAK